MSLQQQLLTLLARHTPFDAHEKQMLEQMRVFVAKHLNCASRQLLEGHITASAWVVDDSREHTLLTWHKKLNRWLQLGGHVEDDTDILKAALREAREESGLNNIKPVSESIFDVDIHSIPARPEAPEHFHYDVRFIFVADKQEPLAVSEESHSVAWVPLANLEKTSSEPSLLRMKMKTASAAVAG